VADLRLVGRQRQRLPRRERALSASRIRLTVVVSDAAGNRTTRSVVVMS
jgi:hypothetical protein